MVTLDSGPGASACFGIPSYGGGDAGVMTLITGSGTVSLPNANTYAGDWEISGGALSVLNANSLGTGTSAVVVDNGGVLQLTNGVSLSRNVTLQNGATLRSSNAGTMNGVVSVASGAAVTLGGSNTSVLTIGDGPNDLTGGSGGSSIAVNAIGAVVLNQPSSYVGNWNINLGVLEFDADDRIGDVGNPIAINNATLRATGTFASSRTITLGAGSGTIDVSGANTLTHDGFINGGTALLFKTGTGKLVLQTNGSSRTGTTFINAGTLALSVSSAAGSGGITNSATLELNNTAIVNALTMNNNSVVRGTGANAAMGGAVNVSGNAVTFTPGSDANDVLRLPVIADQLSGTAGAVINIGEGSPVAGKVIAANSNSSSYLGSWNVNGATLRVEQIQALGGGSSAVTVNSGALELAAGFSRNITLHNGTTLRGTGSGSTTGTITIGAGEAVTLASGASGSDALDITGPTNLVGGTGGSTITVAGGGTVFLSGPSSWTGDWIVNSTLRPNADDRLGNAANNVKLINGRFQIGASFATARNFTVDNGTFDLFAGTTLTLNAPVASSGAATLSKTGPGTVIFAAGQTITGATTITAGTLRLEHDWVTTAPLSITVATLELGNGADFGGPITLNNFAALRGSGSGTVVAGVNTVAPGATVQFNSVNAASDLTIGDGLNDLTGGGGASVINVTGPGKVVLGGPSNNYTGSWVVQNASTLEIGASAQLGNAANSLALQSGKLSFTGSSGSIARTISVLGGSSVNVVNAGTTLTLTSSLTTSGGATINKTGPGTLAISGAQTHGVGATMNVSDGAVALNSAAGTASVRRLNVNVTTPTASLTINTPQYLNALNVSGGGLARLSGGLTNVLATNNLTVTGAGSKFDVVDNKAVVFGGNLGTCVAGTYTGLSGLIQTAYDFGAWDGAGMTTTMPQALSGVTTLAISTADANGFAGGVWGGVSVNSGDVLVMYTYAGDANLDGTIDGGDYGIIDNFAQVPGASGYANGDFNYDSVIDGGDYGIIDNNIQAQGAPFPVSGSVGLSGVTAVPEPSTAGAGILVTLGLLARRRTRRSVRK